MKTEMSEEELYQEAKKRVEEKRGFRNHLIIYLAVNAFLVIIWWVTGAGFPWFVFPLGGWGIGLLFNFLVVYVFSKQPERERDRNEIEKEMETMRRRQK
ncbi:MAG: hypothetical protein CL875_03220 [Dehalococcoidales bacterium]|jgi:uncharacterized membrane protein|nr:hypothetical protein [Dehalococcoidales bacterium]|tara:strand:+ start:837 stop:1133 length:297 start_codon:yes stop_codon:yes gene_type:complete